MRVQNQMAAIVLATLAVLLNPCSVTAHNEHPLGRQPIAWSPDQNILRTLAYNFDFAGGGDFVTWRPPGGVEQRDGRSCLVGPYFFFDVRDAFAFNIDETVTVELLFDRTTTDGFNLSYDHVVNPTVISQEFEKSDERWQRITVKLERARFANRKYGQTDFAIGGLKSLFPPDNSGGGHNVALCDLKISRSGASSDQIDTGRLSLVINDPNGNGTTARVGLYDSEGRAPLAGNEALRVRRFTEQIRDLPLRQAPRAWPSPGRFVFYISDRYEAEIPAGSYTIVVSKGPEYRLHVQDLVVPAGGRSSATIKLHRWIDMPAKGWYSGDDHVHIGRPNPSDNHDILSFTSAEDIHLANLLQMANVTTWHFPQFAFGAAGQFRVDNHSIVPGQESPRTSHRGHTIGLNAKRFHWPEKDYFLYDLTADQIRADGGLFGYAHVAIDGFNVAWGLALDVPLGIVDFVEMLQMGVMNTEYLYDFLNMGYQILPSAGSDYPYIHMAGAERVYAKVGAEFTVQKWFDAWRSRRSFVTNAPTLEFSVNGDMEATEFSVSKGETVTINATARVNPDYDQLARIELVVHGKTVASSTLKDANGAIQLQHSLRADESLWFAIRAYGEGPGKAHSAPVYVYVDGNRRFWNRETAEGLALKYIDMLQTFKGSTPDLNEEWERFNVEDDVLPKWRSAKPSLDTQIERAIEIYKTLINESKGKSRPL